MTPTQRTILNYAQAQGHITKREAVALIGHRYYCNADKHTGAVLTRMVRGGLLHRTKPGHYQPGKGTKNNPATPVAAQPNLFT